MSFADAQTAIEQRLNDNWSSPAPAGPIIFENVEAPQDDNTPTWVRLTVIEAAADKIELANPGVTRHLGTIILQVFVEKGKGTARTGEIADLFDSIFRNATFQQGSSGTIICESITREPVGPSESWYQTNLKCDYRRDVIQSRAT